MTGYSQGTATNNESEIEIEPDIEPRTTAGRVFGYPGH